MCQTCQDTGGIVISNGWSAEFHPCPDTNCEFDNEAALNRSIAILKSKLERCERETV